MAINFNVGDKVIVNQTFVSNTLAPRDPSNTRKALLEHLGRLGNRSLIVSKIINNIPLIKVTVLGSLSASESPAIAFESESDLNNSFTLQKSFTSNEHIITAINGDDEPIGRGRLVMLTGYQGSDPQIPIVSAPNQSDANHLPLFGMCVSPSLP